ncbi:MAG: ABC transporter substrate-binding protein [Leptolyngbya sp. SIO4C5]|nr:ABC transporter substrate-binding protein [Leptolyngbya sp. SIO4C5]
MRPILRSLLVLLLAGSLLLNGCQRGDRRDGVVHLTLWQGISPPSNREVFQSLVQRFNETHPDIEVESLYVGQPDQQIPKILTAVVGNAAPDLLWYVPTLTGQLVELEAIQPLDDWWARSSFQDQLDPALIETMNLEEHIWSVPFATNNAAIFYRPSLFQAAGIEQVPQTWADLRRVAQQLTQDTNGDGRTDQHGIFLSLGKGEWTVFVWLPFVYSAGGQIAQGIQPDLVNPGAIAALQLGADLVQDGSAVLSSPERGYETDSFMAGKVAMQVTGPWTLPQLSESGIDFDVFPFPVKDQPAAVVGGESFFLGQTTPEKTQAAYAFLDYVLSPDFQQTWALETGYLPANLTVRASAAYQQFVQDNPTLKIFLQQMDWARSRPIIPGYTYLSENFGRAIEASLLGTPPAEALRQSQRRLELILGK